MPQTLASSSAVRTCVLKAICLALMLPIAAGCRRDDSSEPPVATPSFSIARERVAIGSPVELGYKFEVAQDATFDRNYWVFVHVLDPDGERLWTDDHQPPVPTTQWKPGQTIEYTRTVFVPNYPYIGEAVVRLGMYTPEESRRLVLAGNEVSRREYMVGRFELLPQSENIFLIDKEGWHQAETDPGNPTAEWRWTQKRAVITFRNPKRDATFYIEYDARSDLFTPPQQVTIRLGGHVVGSFAATARQPTLLTFPISAEQMGDGPMAELSIDVDRAFKPEGGDPRELGIRIFHTFVQPAQE